MSLLNKKGPAYQIFEFVGQDKRLFTNERFCNKDTALNFITLFGPDSSDFEIVEVVNVHVPPCADTNEVQHPERNATIISLCDYRRSKCQKQTAV